MNTVMWAVYFANQFEVVVVVAAAAAVVEDFELANAVFGLAGDM